MYFLWSTVHTDISVGANIDLTGWANLNKDGKTTKWAGFYSFIHMINNNFNTNQKLIEQMPPDIIQ
jgi:hypothetical protein